MRRTWPSTSAGAHRMPTRRGSLTVVGGAGKSDGLMRRRTPGVSTVQSANAAAPVRASPAIPLADTASLPKIISWSRNVCPFQCTNEPPSQHLRGELHDVRHVEHRVRQPGVRARVHGCVEHSARLAVHRPAGCRQRIARRLFDLERGRARAWAPRTTGAARRSRTSHSRSSACCSSTPRAGTRGILRRPAGCPSATKATSTSSGGCHGPRACSCSAGAPGVQAHCERRRSCMTAQRCHPLDAREVGGSDA